MTSLHRRPRTPTTTHIAFLLAVASAFVTQLATAADDAHTIRDLAYKPNATTDYERERCKLDLFLPDILPDNGDRFATIVWFYGGGIQQGDKAGRIETELASRFTQRGIAFVSANYRLHPKANFPDYLDDAAAAFAFIRGKILDYDGDPNFVFLSGHSAGGYLCAMVGMDRQYLARYGLKPSDIAGVMPVAGQMITHSRVRKEQNVAETTPVIDAGAPLNHVRKDAPPFLNIVGSQDLPARAEENRYFVAAMRAVGHPDVTYLAVDGRNHMTIASDIGAADDPVGAVMLAFMNRLRP